MQDQYHREIKSFVLRQSRLTKAQENALKQHAHHYIYPFCSPDINTHLQNKPLDVPTTFTNRKSNPLFNTKKNTHNILEIGFGNGDSLVQECGKHPQTLFFGIEVHLPGVARLIHRAHKAGITNLQIIRADATQAMQYLFPPQLFAQIRIFFPDPWHKKRHHKRRLLNHTFIQTTLRTLKKDGIIHIVTDWQDYAEAIQHNIQAIDKLAPAPIPLIDELIANRPKTAYEKRALSLEHKIYELIYQNIETSD